MRYLWQFTHDDLDGGGSAVIAAHLYPEHDRSVKYCEYRGPRNIDAVLMDFLGNHQPTEGEEHTLLITDILPRMEVCDAINTHRDQFVRVAAYDHHETTLWARNNEKYLWIFHGDACGTRLLYESAQIVSEKMHNFVYAVDAWDRWLAGSRYRMRGETLSMIYEEIGSTEFHKAFHEDLSADSNSWLYQMGIHLRRKRDLGIRAGLAHLDKTGHFFTDPQGRRAVVLFGGANIGMFADAILKSRADIDYVIFLFPTTDTVSLRCRKDDPKVNVAQMASTHPNGGGHQSAAGFPWPMRDFLFDAVKIPFMAQHPPTPGEK